MRPHSVFFLIVTFAGVAFAQDTNFPVGPQYLITTGSPMLLHSIATPSLSLGASQPATNNAVVAETEAAAITPSVSIPSVQVFLSEVFWGDHTAAEIEARRITTPSLSPEQTAVYTYETANLAETAPSGPFPGLPPEANQNSSVIEITSAQLPPNLPESIFNPGVTGTANADSLRDRGYGVSLGEFAAHWKSRKRPAQRVFTNEDLEKLRK